MNGQDLLKAAELAAEKAYAPYSHYCVGAAVLGTDGRVYTGCNVENASYGLTNCAERTALFKMVSDGCRAFTAIAISARGAAAPWPCGACRQVMSELCQNKQAAVYIRCGADTVKQTTVEELLPLAFSLEEDEQCPS